MTIRYFVPAVACLAVFASINAMAGDAPRFLGNHETSPEDRQAIQDVLSGYTQAVIAGDEAAFESLLLDKDNPFAYADDAASPATASGRIDTHRYQDFRDAVFGSGKRYSQHFYHVRIEQDGALAQASLDFVTRDAKTGKGSYGFKVLQLLKVQGKWKIASEFYTGHAAPDPA